MERMLKIGGWLSGAAISLLIFLLTGWLVASILGILILGWIGGRIGESIDYHRAAHLDRRH